MTKRFFLLGLALTGATVVLTGAATPPPGLPAHPDTGGFELSATVASLVPSLVIPVDPTGTPRVCVKTLRGALDDETMSWLTEASTEAEPAGKSFSSPLSFTRRSLPASLPEDE